MRKRKEGEPRCAPLGPALPQLPRADPAQDGPSTRTAGEMWRAWRRGNPTQRKRDRTRDAETTGFGSLCGLLGRTKIKTPSTPTVQNQPGLAIKGQSYDPSL